MTQNSVTHDTRVITMTYLRLTATISAKIVTPVCSCSIECTKIYRVCAPISQWPGKLREGVAYIKYTSDNGQCPTYKCWNHSNDNAQKGLLPFMLAVHPHLLLVITSTPLAYHHCLLQQFVTHNLHSIPIQTSSFQFQFTPPMWIAKGWLEGWHI